jgi:hypothetical protein
MITMPCGKIKVIYWDGNQERISEIKFDMSNSELLNLIELFSASIKFENVNQGAKQFLF